VSIEKQKVRSITVAVRVSPDTLKELRKIAAKDNRTVSYLLDKLGKEHIENVGKNKGTS